jgi:hypothetical protein
LRPTSSLHWASQLSPCAQSFQRGYSLPPILNTGGASYANSDEVGMSDLSLLLGGVVHYALLNNTSYSLPLPIQLHWVHSLFGGRECPSIPNVWTYSSTVEAHATQAPSSLSLPLPWPSGSQSTEAPSSRAAISALGSQPIYCEWMGLGGGIVVLTSAHFFWISVLWKSYWETCFLTKFASSGVPCLVSFGSFG